MMNVDSYVEGAKFPSVKQLGERLVISSMIEDVQYRIHSIDNADFLSCERAPALGDTLVLDYSFKAGSGGMRGYEHLTLFSWRKGGSFVRYFKTVKDLEAALLNVVLLPDTTYARTEISKMQMRIRKMQEDYGLNTSTA
jgi:hypothetical protein